jgi:hypothetical protein
MELGGVVWPEDIDMSDSVATFVEFFSRYQYEEIRIDDVGHILGVEKIAIYANSNGDVMHVARQSPNTGTWHSKMGPEEDIEHRHPNDVVGGQCGDVAAVMARGHPLPDPQPTGASELWLPS